MKNTVFFKKLTFKIYENILKKAEELGHKKGTHPLNYDIELNKEIFTDSEWTFITDNEDNFTFSVEVNGRHQWYQVYKIINDSLFSNESNVFGLPNKYKQ